jgi:FkbM family methyltransferase
MMITDNFARKIVKKISNTWFFYNMFERFLNKNDKQVVINGERSNISFFYRFITLIARFNKSGSFFKTTKFFFKEEFSMRLDANEYTQCGYLVGIVDNDLLSLFDRVENKGVFVDIGANVGIYSLSASQVFNKVYSFEPSSATFHLLKQNIILNKSDNITAMNMALSNTIGVVDLHHNPLNNGGASLNKPGNDTIRKHADYDWSRTESVKVDKLDNVCSNIDGRIDLIKIDVEGRDISVIKGGLEIIKLHNPLIYVEVSGDYEKVVEIIDLLPPTYFAYSLVDNKDLSTVNYHIPSDVLFLPEGKRSYLI